jgi:hypothetical protein
MFKAPRALQLREVWRGLRVLAVLEVLTPTVSGLLEVLGISTASRLLEARRHVVCVNMGGTINQ